MEYSNQDDNVKRFKTQRCYLLKGVIKNYSVIISGKDFYDQPIYSDIKQYEEIRTLSIRQGEDYTTVVLLGYEYIKQHYKSMAVDLNRKKRFRSWSKSNSANIFGQLLNKNNLLAGNGSMFVLTILEKTKETRLKYCQVTVTALKKMENWEDANAELASIQLKKLKSEAKDKPRKTVKINRKNLQDEELPHKLFVTTRRKTKVGNAFSNTMST